MAERLVDFEEILSHLSPAAMSDQEKFLVLLKKLHPKSLSDLRSDRFYKHRTEDFQSMKSVLIDKANEDWL